MLLSREQYTQETGVEPTPEMQFVDPVEETAAPDEVSGIDVMQSQMERNNVYSSYLAKWEHFPSGAPPEKDYDYNLAMPNEYVGTPHEAEYMKTTNTAQADWVTGNLEREQRNIKIEQEGGAGTFVAGMAAAALSPESAAAMAIPAGAVLSKGMKMRVTGALAAEAGVTTASVAAGEALLHQTQTERTIEESVFAVGASVLFTGALTGAGYKFNDVQAAARSMEDTMATVEARPAITEITPEIRQDASAAETIDALPGVVQRELDEKYQPLMDEAQAVLDNLNAQKAGNTDPNFLKTEFEAARLRLDEIQTGMKAEQVQLGRKMSQVKNPRLYRALGYISPITRLATSKSHRARVLSAQMLTSPLQQIRNQYGETLGASVENMADSFTHTSTLATKQTVDDQYKVYKSAYKQGLTDTDMDFDEFSRQISYALRDGDQHTNPAIQSAAETLRSTVMKPIEDRMMNMGMIKKDFEGFENLTREQLSDYVEAEDLDRLFRKDGDGNEYIDAKRAAKLPLDTKEILANQDMLVTKAALPKGDTSYLHRAYDFQRIQNNKEGFEDDLIEIFRQDAITRLDDDIALKEDELDYLTFQRGDTATDVQGKRTADEFSAQKKKKMADLEKKIANQKRSRTQYNNDLLRRAKTHDTTDWPEYEKVLLKAEAKDAELKESFKEMRELRGSKMDTDSRIAQAKWDVKLAKEGYDANRLVLEAQLSTAAKEVREAILSENWNVNSRIKSFKAGPLKERVIDIPSSKIQKWLINDIQELNTRWMMGVAPELALREKFDWGDGGDIDVLMKDTINETLDEYNAMARAAKTDKERRRLHKERDTVQKDLGASYEMIMGRYRMPETPNGFLDNAAKELRKFQFTTKLGMMTISALPDLGHIIMRRGMGGTARYMKNFALMSDATKKQHEVARAASLGIDLATNERARRLFLNDTVDPLTAQSKFQNTTDKAVDFFGKATGMPYWNAGLKTMVGSIYSDEILKAAVKSTKGQLSAKDTAAFANNGLGKQELKEIADAFKAQKGESEIDGVFLADLKQWDPALAERFKLALLKETEMTIVTPGKGDLPLVAHSFAGKLVFQFKSFAMAANNRILLATLDDMNYKKVSGAISMVGMGAMGYVLRETLKGKEPDMDPQRLINEGLERSGLFAFWSDPNSMVEKATAGEVHMGRLWEELGITEEAGMSSRYASRNMLGSFLGVNAGTVQDIGMITSAMASGEWSESDLRAIRRAIYMNNLWLLHSSFSRMEEK